jgi:Cation efflux family
VTETEDASVRTVAVAVAANLLTAVAKGVAAILTGSAAMTAETAHSVADTFNEVLLYVGVRHGARPADDRHPFGYGQARYFWSLMAAVGIFVVGGLFAIADGVQTYATPSRSPTCRWAWPCCWSRRPWRACRGARPVASCVRRPVSATSTSASISPPRRTRRPRRCSCEPRTRASNTRST